MLGALLLISTPPIWLTVGFVGLLAATRPILKDWNYLLYASVMIPLIFLLLSLGMPATPACALRS